MKFHILITHEKIGDPYFFLSELSPILELFPFDKITLKSHICIVVTIMGKQCWSQAESGSWGHSVLQTPALVDNIFHLLLDFHVEAGTRFLLRDKRLFVISEAEITRVSCIFCGNR